VEGSHGVGQGLALAQLLLTLPFADLIPRHTVEDVVLVTDPEESGGEPPLNESSDPRSPAPAVRIAAALVVARVVDAMEQRAVGHGGSVARLRRITEAGWSATRREVVARGRAANRPPDQATAAERQWRKHVLTVVAADLSLVGGPVVRRLLRETPNPHCHPNASGTHRTPAAEEPAMAASMESNKDLR